MFEVIEFLMVSNKELADGSFVENVSQSEAFLVWQRVRRHSAPFDFSPQASIYKLGARLSSPPHPLHHPFELPALSSKMPVPKKPLCEYAASDLLNSTVPLEDVRKEIIRRLEIRRRTLSSEQYDKLITTKHCSDPKIPAEAFIEMGVLQVLNAMEAGKPGGIFETKGKKYGAIVMTKEESVVIFGDDENDSCC
jgi:hypothetical protein